VRRHKNSWIYLTSTYYWWLLTPTITIRFDSKWKKNTIRTSLILTDINIFLHTLQRDDSELCLVTLTSWKANYHRTRERIDVLKTDRSNLFSLFTALNRKLARTVEERNQADEPETALVNRVKCQFNGMYCASETVSVTMTTTSLTSSQVILPSPVRWVKVVCCCFVAFIIIKDVMVVFYPRLVGLSVAGFLCKTRWISVKCLEWFGFGRRNDRGFSEDWVNEFWATARLVSALQLYWETLATVMRPRSALSAICSRRRWREK